MAVISTKELFDAFFEGKPSSTVERTRKQIDRPEVYEYEMKIGKSLVDMNGDELMEMILTFKNKKSVITDGVSISGASFRKYVSAFRMLFEFYINNYEVKLNPFNSSKFKGLKADAFFSENTSRMTYNDLEKIIIKIHQKYEIDRANYLELILLLFYNGFRDAKEIVELKADMINFRKKEVRLPGRTVKLSDRCFELLVMNNQMEIIKCRTGTHLMLSWNGGYFKSIVRQNEMTEFNHKDATYVGRKINRSINTQIMKELGIDINYRKLYLLGIYDFGVRKYGEDRMREILTSYKVQEDYDDFVALANEYPVLTENIGELKRNLMQFI